MSGRVWVIGECGGSSGVREWRRRFIRANRGGRELDGITAVWMTIILYLMHMYFVA